MMPNEKLKLLLVDDSPMMRQVLALSLSRNYHITTCEDGAVALNQLQLGYVPDIIVTDFEMPNMDGLQLTQAIRTMGLNCPILMASSIKDPSMRQTALAAGVNTFLVKPVLPMELKHEILALLENPRWALD
jgi:two-component system chemotaxis response regulator CheY